MLPHRLDVFYWVVRLNSFTKAAVQLNISPSMASQHVSKLEEQIAVKLLTRTTRSLRLTLAGKQLFQFAEQFFTQFDQTLVDIQSKQSSPQGLIRINAQTDFGVRYLAPAIRRFKALYSDVNFDLALEDRTSDLHQDQIDIAFVMTRQQLPDSQYVALDLKMGGQIIVCAAPAFVQEYGEPKTLADLQALPHVLLSQLENASVFGAYTEDGYIEDFCVHDALTTNTSMGLQALSKVGLGCVLLPEIIAKPLLETKELLRLLPRYHFGKYRIFALSQVKAYRPYAVSKFLEWLPSNIE